MTDVDDILRQLGGFGRYQILQFSLLCLYGCWFTAWNMMSIVFTASTPPLFYCTPPPEFSVNDTVPLDDMDGDGVATWKSCERYVVHDETVVTDNVKGYDYARITLPRN